MLARSFIGDYKNRTLPFIKTLLVHKKGFTAADWCYLGLNKENYRNYLSDADYMMMHPLNGRFSAWIDDKLTLKYLFAGTELDCYMPKYYYQIDSLGRVLRLIDSEEKSGGVFYESIAELLEKKKELAIKRIAGELGEGFYKAEFQNNVYYMNGRQMSKDEFCKKLAVLKDYLITEYLHPHRELAQYCPDTVNSIRYLLGKMDEKLVMLKGFIRFGTKQSGFVENYNAGGVLCYLDQYGRFTEGNIIDKNFHKNQVISTHPDNGQELKGIIPKWDEITKVGRLLETHFPQLTYLGIDIVVTDSEEVKILEINSLTSLDTLQMDGSILEKSSAGEYFKERL